MCYLAGVAAQCDSAVEGYRSEPDRGSIGTAREHRPQADMLPAVGACPVRLLIGNIFAPILEEERADRRRLVWTIEHNAADDLEARAQGDRICGMPPASCNAETTSSRLPIRPTLMGSPGIPCAVDVTISRFERPGSCSTRDHVAGKIRYLIAT